MYFLGPNLYNNLGLRISLTLIPDNFTLIPCISLLSLHVNHQNFV